MKITRRDFLGMVTVAGLTPFTRGSAQAAEALIDPHFHIWDLGRFRLPWLDGAGPVLKRTFTLDDYRAAVAGLGVEKSVYVEVSVTPEQREDEARYAVGLCQGTGKPTSAVVVGGAPGTDGFETYIRKLGENRAVHGVRASIARGGARDPGIVRDIRLLGKLALSFDLLWDGQNLGEAAELAGAAPQTTFVLDHCGNASTNWFAAGADPGAADRWKRGIELVAKQTNVACKISGVAESGPRESSTLERVAPVVNHCLDAFRADRVMFASNWPVCLKSVTIAGWVEMLKGITARRGRAFAEKLFHDNAAKWYRLDRD
jgi:predicted TIM-barrel fold metal-dependent hydrolase